MIGFTIFMLTSISFIFFLLYLLLPHLFQSDFLVGQRYVFTNEGSKVFRKPDIVLILDQIGKNTYLFRREGYDHEHELTKQSAHLSLTLYKGEF